MGHDHGTEWINVKVSLGFCLIILDYAITDSGCGYNPLRTPTLTLMHMLAYVVHMQARLPLARGYGPLLCKFVHW